MNKHFLLLICLLALTRVSAQKPHAYFTVQEMPDAVQYLPAPPDSASMCFAYDTAQYQWGKRQRSTPRGQQAKDDADYGIYRMATIFSPAIGVTISPNTTPQLWKLLIDATYTAGRGCDIVSTSRLLSHRTKKCCVTMVRIRPGIPHWGG